MRRFAAILCAIVLLFLTAAPALAEFSDAPVKYYARNTVALKIRRDPAKDANGVGSLPRDSAVNILDLGAEWSKIRTERTEGYILTRYLTDIAEAEPGTGIPATIAAVTSTPMDTNTADRQYTYGAIEIEQSPNAVPGFKMAPDNFRPLYNASTVKAASVYETPNGRYRNKLKIYTELVVGEIVNDWCIILYNGEYYYMHTNDLFKWDRIEPYAGAIPGLEIWDELVFVNHTTHITSTKNGKELKTMNPGAALGVAHKDSEGRYLLPYHREYGYITENDVSWSIPVVPWPDAESGDLISVFTTFFAIGKSTLQYQGRNWNIRLASNLISGTVLQPGDSYNQNKVIGPYAKSTGYHEAPIMSQTKLTGFGGGTCQVNSTFYDANIAVPILITHRKVHANVGIYYIKKGFDAAVGGGDINLELINTLPYAIRYQIFVSDGVLTVCIFRA